MFTFLSVIGKTRQSYIQKVRPMDVPDPISTRILLNQIHKKLDQFAKPVSGIYCTFVSLKTIINFKDH